MAAPTFVSFALSDATYVATTATKTIAPTLAVGDLVVVISLSGNAGTPVNTVPSGSGLTFTQRATLGVAGTTSRAVAFTAVASTAGAITVTITRPAAVQAWQAYLWVWRNHGGVGAIGAPTVGTTSNSATLTCSANSGLSVGSADWASVDGTSRTRRTINASTGTEDGYFRNTTDYAAYGSHYLDTGAAGSVTAGYSAPTGQQSAIIAVEVLGTNAIPPILIMQTRRAY